MCWFPSIDDQILVEKKLSTTGPKNARYAKLIVELWCDESRALPEEQKSKNQKTSFEKRPKVINNKVCWGLTKTSADQKLA